MDTHFYTRTSKLNSLLPALIMGLSFGILTPANALENLDFTSSVKLLGNPLSQYYPGQEQAYARNIWDLQLFDNKIFLGAGNSSNSGPTPNAGPVSVIALNPADDQFNKEGELRDEQIDIYRIIDNQLIIPGHDPTQDWSLGNYYKRLKENSWFKFRNIPDAVHNYDMVAQNDKLFAALGLSTSGSVVVSTDKGATWKTVAEGSSRFSGFVKLQDKLYAMQNTYAKYDLIYEYKPSDDLFTARKDLRGESIFPDSRISTKLKLKMMHSQNFDNKVIYIGVYKHNDHQNKPFGVYLAESLEASNVKVKAITLPEDATPRDILIEGKDIYILASAKDIYAQPVTNYVFHANTSAPETFTRYIQFQAGSFARAFELYQNTFYFGLGTEIADPEDWKLTELNDHAGEILKLTQPAVQ